MGGMDEYDDDQAYRRVTTGEMGWNVRGVGSLGIKCDIDEGTINPTINTTINTTVCQSVTIRFAMLVLMGYGAGARCGGWAS
jgi:hypothetical protein